MQGPPESHVFYLSRRGSLQTLLVLVLLGAGLVAAALVWPGPGAQAARQSCLVLAAAAFLGVAWVVSGLVRPMPYAVVLDETGAHLQWRDREEHWPWDELKWQHHGSHGLELVPQSRGCGLPVAFVARAERQLFWAMLVRSISESLGQREAALLAAGEPVRLPTRRRLDGFIGLVFAALALTAKDVSLLTHAWDGQVGSPHGLHWSALWPYALTVVVLALLVREVRVGSRKVWFELRFTPAGLEERWPGGGALWPYDQLDSILCEAGRMGVHRLTVQLGKQALRLSTDLQHYWGAVHLLRQHVPAERWIEAGVPSLVS